MMKQIVAKPEDANIDTATQQRTCYCQGGSVKGFKSRKRICACSDYRVFDPRSSSGIIKRCPFILQAR
jgi:hypothetical protein